MTLQHAHLRYTPIALMPEPLTAAQAGDLVRRRREGRGLTQDQLADSLNIDKSYISKLEGGVYHVARSKYFPRIAELLNLSEDDIRGINPSAVFSLPAEPASISRPGLSSPSAVRSGALSAASKYGKVPRREIEIPDALREAAEQYGHLPIYAGISERRWQHFMVTASRRSTPQDVEGWLREFSELKRMDYDPEEPE